MAKNVILRIAVRADVVAHVLDDAENRNPGLLEHAERLHRNAKANILRRRNDDGPGQRHGLGQREVHITGAGREVHH